MTPNFGKIPRETPEKSPKFFLSKIKCIGNAYSRNSKTKKTKNWEENSKSAICKNNNKKKQCFGKNKFILFSRFLLKKFGGRPKNVIIAENCSAADPKPEDQIGVA